ncbi:hypothetical protein ASB57_07205 [Bordetella sp. N]|nr:hypothetical protein ASB57_07205 [Bordetella sp. N]
MAAGAAPVADEAILVNAYGTVAALPPLNFPHELLGKRDLSDPELPGHLQGFVGYVLNRGDGQMTRSRYHLMRHLQRVQQHVSLSFATEHQAAFTQWAEQANAVMFLTDGSVRDPQGRVVIDAAGNQDEQAQIPYPRAAWDRKSRTEALLEQHGIRVSPTLPPLISETEVQLRPAAEVAGRAMALLVVAARAESLNSPEGPVPIEQLKERVAPAFRYLTPAEQAFLDEETPSEKATVQMTWRYESLALLGWALGLLPTLSLPPGICDVPGVVRTFLDTVSGEWPAQAQLRPATEILDALDLYYRLHWVTREASLGRGNPPAEFLPGVIQERHYALNWLVRFENADWDDVDTPT